MSVHKNRLHHFLFALVLMIALAACGGSPTPAPETATPTPTATETAAGTPEPPAATPTSAAPEPPKATPTAAPELPAATATPTPTPTPAPLPAATTPAPPASRCEGLAGQLEVQILVGPADAVGLEPVAVGSVPFAVTGSGPPYLVQGQGPISYADVLTAEWGTYTVTMDMDAAVQGDCSGPEGSEQLNLALELTGEQLVEVKAEGFHGEYPWAGTQTRDLTFPLEEGASAQGEGWAVVLHLSAQ